MAAIQDLHGAHFPSQDGLRTTKETENLDVCVPRNIGLSLLFCVSSQSTLYLSYYITLVVALVTENESG